MKVRDTDTAAREVDDVLAYIAQRNRAAAVQLANRIDQVVGALAGFPEMAQATDEPNVRRMPAGRYPYSILYTIESDEVAILHVRHAARRYPRLSDDI